MKNGGGLNSQKNIRPLASMQIKKKYIYIYILIYIYIFSLVQVTGSQLICKHFLEKHKTSENGSFCSKDKKAPAKAQSKELK